MPGAATLIATNYLYKIAKPDGLTIGNINGGLFMGQVMNQEGIDFDARKFEYIGCPNQERIVFVFTKRSGINSMEKWINSKRPLKMGGTGPGSLAPDQAIKIVKEALGLPIQLVSNYKGTAQIRLACEGGELDGTCRTLDSMRMDWKKAWETGEVVIVLQATPTPLPELPGVPLAMNYAKTSEAQQLIQAGIYDPGQYFRPYILPPSTPKELVQILRDAFMGTMRDPEFMAEAAKAKMSLDPVSGEELEKLVLGIFKVDRALVSKLKAILEL
jgi:tripartite-type tricarboxylate transporter receptor subunit TctC